MPARNQRTERKEARPRRRGRVLLVADPAARQSPGKECEVAFAIDPETFLAEDSVAAMAQRAA